MHYNQTYTWTYCMIKSCTVTCISSKMCILVLTDTVQSWMYYFMVLTATKASASTLILRNHSESKTVPLLFSPHNLMLDYETALYSPHLSTQYLHNLLVCQTSMNLQPLTVNISIFVVISSLCLLVCYMELDLNLVLFAPSQKVSVILQSTVIFVSGMDT